MENHVSGLLPTLVVSLVAAFAGGLAVRTIRLPPLIGYILAGIIVGPFSPGYVVDQSVAAELADVGVALLLFNIGLHFSLKDLFAVRKIALFGALAQMAVSSALGFVVARTILDCAFPAALLIGLSVSTASTAICTRLLEERRQASNLAGKIALGWSVVQDIVVIFALVLFPVAINADRTEANLIVAGVGQTFLQLFGFAVVILLGARRLVPKLLRHVARAGSRELFTLAVIVVALGIAYGSSAVFGVSLALGAFFAGVVIGETDLNHHAAAEALSMQQVFSILFFVSVGMLFNPLSVIHAPIKIFALWLAVVVGMGLATFAILLLYGVPAPTAGLVGGVFSQVGEITFVLSQVGREWGVLRQIDRDLILAVAVFSIILAPIMVAAFVRLGNFIGEKGCFDRFIGSGGIHMPDSIKAFSGHAILVGQGRVGKIVSEALRAHGVSCVTIEADRRIMEKLRATEYPVVFGDASRDAVLSAACPEEARLIIVTIPDSNQVRRIAALAKRFNPSIEIIVRVHDDFEARNMGKLGISLAVMGEREIGLGLSASALQCFGVESHEVLETIDKIRQEAAAEQV